MVAAAPQALLPARDSAQTEFCYTRSQRASRAAARSNKSVGWKAPLVETKGSASPFYCHRPSAHRAFMWKVTFRGRIRRQEQSKWTHMGGNSVSLPPINRADYWQDGVRWCDAIQQCDRRDGMWSIGHLSIWSMSSESSGSCGWLLLSFFQYVKWVHGYFRIAVVKIKFGFKKPSQKHLARAQDWWTNNLNLSAHDNLYMMHL